VTKGIALRTVLQLIAVVGICSATAISQSLSPPVVAIASGPDLSLYDASGKVVQHIDLKHPVAGFALSPDRSKLVVVLPDTEHGGALILIDLKTGSRKKLTAGPFAFRHLNPGEKEVYDSPAFSPDGRRLVFAVHGNQPGDGNDAFENSGPLAILDLDEGNPKVLKATNRIPGEAEGPCSEGDAQWSPNGRWILFNCEDGAFLTDPQGKTLRNLNIGTADGGSSAVGWVGTRCVLYAQTPEKDGHFDFDHESLKVLNLTNSQSSDAGFMFSEFRGRTSALLRASQDALIRGIWPETVVVTKGRTWKFKQPNQGPPTVVVQLLTGWDPSSIPFACR
jgi:hypothetical protein